MKIKDIRQFRTFFKTHIKKTKDPNRNEHFIGTTHYFQDNDEPVFGFFEMYHGDKEGFNESDGIRGFLEGFLDMAKDGQAVYEFMQNAVDARSTNFCLFWGKDEEDGNTYLLVLNNGDMFTMDSVRSILNVGVSTKSSNNFTIGKFGIGFKLAHRLVGRENGLDELIHQNYGPILFSWQNQEVRQLDKLIEEPEVVPTEQQYEVFSENGKRKAVIKTPEPWLFKILITNFPCQPENGFKEELIYDNQFQPKTSAFSKDEVKVLAKWVRKHKDFISDDFNKGSLFFIRLGQGKQSHLEEENLEEGVKFSLAILNKIAKKSLDHDGLHKLNLNGKEIQPVNLEFEPFIVSKTENQEQYRFLRFAKTDNLSDMELSKEQADSDIEILLGYTDFRKAQEAFHNAPNFYLFFPLSEEKHRLRFILHSNAFYKSASRTFLQKGSVGEEGINERIFKVFVEKLSERMLSWSTSADGKEKQKFVEIYANLLLSDASDNPERVWINEPLYHPILELVKKNIPVRSTPVNHFTLVQSSDKVFIKDTALPVDEYDWVNEDLHWFYWQATEAALAAEAEKKLKVKRFTIVNLLQQKGVAATLNLWLEKEAYELVPHILEELNAVNLSDVKDDTFRENLGKLAIWQFDDGFYSLEQIGREEEYSVRLILFDTLDAVKEQLAKAKWKLSKHSLTEFSNLASYVQNRFQAVVKYIRKNEELIRVLNLRMPDAELSLTNKLDVVKVLAKKLSDDKDDRISKIRELKLFKNKSGEVVPLKSLLKEANIGWLGSWVIRSDEYDTILDDYFIQKPLDIYVNIVVTYWDLIVVRLSSTELRSIFDYARGVYKQNSGAPVLHERNIISINGNFISPAQPHYYCNTLLDLSEVEFQAFRSIAAKLGIGNVPDFNLLSFYNEQPFKLEEKRLVYNLAQNCLSVTADEASAFLRVCLKQDAELLRKILLFETKDGNLSIQAKQGEIFLIFSENAKVNDYVETYHSNLFRTFPLWLKDHSTSIILQGDALIKHLITKCDLNDEEQLARLVEIVIESGIESRIFLADRFPSLTFDLKIPVSQESSSVRLIKFLLTLNDAGKASAIVKSKVLIQQEDENVILSKAHLMGQNEIIFELQEKQYTLLLASILPNRDSIATEMVGRLVEKLVQATGSDGHVLEALFGLKGTVDKGYIYEQLKQLYVDKPLDNSHQLAFLLHYTKSISNAGLELFTINTLTNVVPLAGATVYTHESDVSYLPPSLLLEKKYEGLKGLIPSDQPYFQSANNTRIYFRTYFDGSRFHLPGVSNISEEAHRMLLLDDLYNHWKSDEEKYSFIELSEKKEWISVLGLEPSHTIINSEWALDIEKAPGYIMTWLGKSEHEVNSTKRYEFLKSIGVSLGGSDIVKIRKFLSGKDQASPIVNYKIPEGLIRNTLVFLYEKNIKNLIESPQAEFVKQWFGRLPADFNFKTVPLPILDKDESATFCVAFVKDACLLKEEDYNRLMVLNYPISDLPTATGKQVVLASHLGGQKQLAQLLAPLQIEFGILDEEKIVLNAFELNRSFYSQWKQAFPNLTILQYQGQLPYLLKHNNNIIFQYTQNDIVRTDRGIIVNGEKNDKSIIALIELHGFLPENAVNYLKQLYYEYDDGIQDFLLRIQSSDKLRMEFEKLKEKEKLEQMKKELSEDIGQNTPYTMKWFMSLLELMVMSGGGDTLANPQGDIVFSGMKYNPVDLRVVTLTGPSKIISPNIEIYTDFFTTFTYLEEGVKRSKKIKISGVSKKGSELNVIPSNHLELNGINLSEVKQVELVFTRSLDLIKKLKNAFSLLGFPDQYNMQKELSENIQFIFGPPGTGKTTDISKRVIERIQSSTQKNILILTPTNKAADVLANRILELCDDMDYPDNWLVRFGASTDLALLDRGLVYDGNTFKLHLYNKCVFVTTVQRFPYEKIVSAEGADGVVKTLIADISWDTIVFDEASMIMLPAIVYPLFKRKYTNTADDLFTEFIVGGDPLQIPPIYDISDADLGEDNEGIKEENIYTMVGLQSFDTDVQAKVPKYGRDFGNKIVNLETQYRSIEPIGTIFSKFQYNGRLEHGRNQNKGGSPQPRPLPQYFKDLGFKPITIIRYPVNTEDAIYNPQKLNDSPFHLYSAFLVNELILKLREKVEDKWNVGVLSPYRPQANLLNRLLESHLDKSKLEILSDTVHGFQGGECEIVFAVFNPSSIHASRSRFFKKEYIINVAISRARDHLVLLIPDLDGEMRKLPLFHSNQEPQGIMTIINSLPPGYVANLNAIDLERKLTGKPNYFQNNSFTNTHQSVNVYSDLFKDYIVRYNNSSLDVHLKPR